VPHAYYRPAIRHKARDGFCPLGPRITARAAIADPDQLTVRVYIDGVRTHTPPRRSCCARGTPARRRHRVHDAGTGDVLAVARRPSAAGAGGQRAAIEIDGLGRLENPIVAGGA